MNETAKRIADDLRRLGVAAGDLVAVPLGPDVAHVPARIVPTLVDGVAGVPVGLEPFGRRPLPHTARITRA